MRRLLAWPALAAGALAQDVTISGMRSLTSPSITGTPSYISYASTATLDTSSSTSNLSQMDMRNSSQY